MAVMISLLPDSFRLLEWNGFAFSEEAGRLSGCGCLVLRCSLLLWKKEELFFGETLLGSEPEDGSD